MSDSDELNEVPQAAEGQPDEELRAPGLKALHAEREAREQADRRAKELQDRLDAIEAEKLSELEKAQKAAKDAVDAVQAKDAEIAKATADALRWRIAARNGITDEDAELFLTGSDEDTLTRQAERLAERAPSSKGTVVPSAGKQPGEPPSLDTQIAAAQERGDTATVMALKSQKLAGLAGQN